MINNWSKAGFVASIIYGGMAVLWYYIQYPNTNEFLECIAIAVLIFGIAFLYNSVKNLEAKFDYFETKVQENLRG